MTWEAGSDRGSPEMVLGVLGVAVVAFGFQQTAVIPVIPTIQRELHASRTWSAWLLSGYLVASSVFTPAIGKLGDRFGKRRMLLGSLAAFLAGSTGCALAPSFAVLVLFRAVQGIGGAVFPLTLAIARDVLAKGRVGLGVSLLTGGFGLGTAIGFGCSGLLARAPGGWRWVFGAGGVVVAVAIVLAIVFVTGSRPARRAGLDLTGAGLLGAALALLLGALTEGQPRGWGAPLVLTGFVLGAVLLAMWVARELRVDEPLIDLRLLARRPVLLTNLATMALGYVLFGVYFLLPYLVTEAPNSGGPMSAGLILLPAALGQLAAAPLSDRLANRIKVRGVFVSGLALVTASALGLTFAHHGLAPAAWGLLLGAGTGFGIATGSTVITETAVDTESGVATAMNSVLRRVGGGIGGQVSAALVAGAAPGGSSGMFATAFGVCAVVASAGTALTIAVR